MKKKLMVLAVILIYGLALIFGGYYIGANVACKNGGGVLAGDKCINTIQLTPVITPDDKTIYVNDTLNLPEGFRVA